MQVSQIAKTACIPSKSTLILQVEPASMDKLETYIELFYEDIPDKIKATQYIQQLVKIPANAEELINNGK
jgi:hypothetical protein